MPCDLDDLEQCVAEEVGQAVHVLDGLYGLRVRAPEKDPHVFFNNIYTTAVNAHPGLCAQCRYTYSREWFIYSELIIKHQYFDWLNPIDVEE